MDKPSILIVKLSAIGDVVHTLPALNALRRYYPKAHIAWLVEEAAANLVSGHPALDRLLVSHRKTWLKGLGSTQWRQHAKQIKSFVKSMRDRHYDMVFDFQAALKGAALIALVRGQRKIGFGPGLEHQELSHLVLNERVPAVSMDIHALERGLIMLQAAGIPTPNVEYRLPIKQSHRLRAGQFLSKYGIEPQQAFAVINPMAKWETKLWRIDRFAQVADRVQRELHLPVVFTGGSEDNAYVKAIKDQMKSQASNVSGQTDLLTLAALLERAALMITTDTGPMHIAAAVGTPTVALFGPTAPWRTGPYGEGHRILRSTRACCPCFKRACPQASACMSDISVAQVVSAAAELAERVCQAPRIAVIKD